MTFMTDTDTREMHEFLGRVRALWNIDREQVPGLTFAQWERFRDAPLRTLIHADDATAAVIWRAVQARVERANPIDVAAATPIPRPLSEAPHDGTLLSLLVIFTTGHLEDTDQPHWTIGSHNGDNDMNDTDWTFAGWDWTQDCYITGQGEVIGWLPFHGDKQ